MGSTFDIFKVTSDGPLWVEAVPGGLVRAKEQMAHLALTSPGEYFVHCQEQGVIAKTDPRMGGGSLTMAAFASRQIIPKNLDD